MDWILFFQLKIARVICLYFMDSRHDNILFRVRNFKLIDKLQSDWKKLSWMREIKDRREKNDFAEKSKNLAGLQIFRQSKFNYVNV